MCINPVLEVVYCFKVNRIASRDLETAFVADEQSEIYI